MRPQSERKPDIALEDLRKKTRACFGRLNDVRRRRRPAGRERVFVERDVDEIGKGRNRIVIRRAQGACPDGSRRLSERQFNAGNFRAAIKARHEKRSK